MQILWKRGITQVILARKAIPTPRALVSYICFFSITIKVVEIILVFKRLRGKREIEKFSERERARKMENDAKTKV